MCSQRPENIADNAENVAEDAIEVGLCMPLNIASNLQFKVEYTTAYNTVLPKSWFKLIIYSTHCSDISLVHEAWQQP